MPYRRSPQENQSSAPVSTPTSSAVANCDPSTFSSASNGTTTSCSTTNGDGSFRDWGSGGVWGIVLSLIAGLLVLALLLWTLRRFIRHRQRQRIRSVLWEIVRGIQAGTIEESYLRRLVNAELYSGERAPILYETHLSLVPGRNQDPFNTDEKPKSINRSPFADPKPTDNKWRWRDFVPLSITPPYPLSTDPKLAYPKFKPKRSSLLSWKGRPISLQSLSSKSRANIAEETELQSRTSTSRESRSQEPYIVRVERGMDTIVAISMPHPDRPQNRPLPLKRTDLHPQIVEVPIKLGSLSTSFLEDILEPIEPPLQRKPKPPFFKRKKETLSNVLHSIQEDRRELRRLRDEERRREREEREREERERMGRWIDETPDWHGFSNVQYRRPARPAPAATASRP